MTSIDLKFKGSRFKPGQVLDLRLVWADKHPFERMSLSLVWHTRGRGTPENHIAFSVDIENQNPSGDQRISLRLPDGPYSYSGKFITLSWTLEAILHESEQEHIKTIVIGPNQKEQRN